MTLNPKLSNTMYQVILDEFYFSLIKLVFAQWICSYNELYTNKIDAKFIASNLLSFLVSSIFKKNSSGILNVL